MFLFFASLLQFAQAENPFRVEIMPTMAYEGQQSTVDLVFVVPEGHHLYVDMLSVLPKPDATLQFNTAVFPPGELKLDPANPEQMREIYTKSTKVKIPIQPLKFGSYPALIEVRYQGCKEGLCYMPKAEELSTVIVVNK